LYRARPSVQIGKFSEADPDDQQRIGGELQANPNPLRWAPFNLLGPNQSSDFVQGLRRISGAGDVRTRNGLNIYVYGLNKSMNQKAMFNSDGDLLIVPQCGVLLLRTEFGRIQLSPNEICVIPQGIRFSIDLMTGSSNLEGRGYVLEVFDGHFTLPQLGPIGANGLAAARDFQSPTAWVEAPSANKIDCEYTIVNKYQGKLFTARQKHSPYDVVAWHGNYVPFKYDLNRFMAINTVSFDHCVSRQTFLSVVWFKIEMHTIKKG
jgi:homogentisate 1,2-dioxygenase